METTDIAWARFKHSESVSGITATAAQSQHLRAKASWSGLTSKTFSSSVRDVPSEMRLQTRLDLHHGQVRPSMERVRQVRSDSMKYKSTQKMQQLCHVAALARLCATEEQIMGSEPRYNRGLNFHERVTELAQATEAEWIVANYLGYEFNPFRDTMKTQADVGDKFEVKHTENGFHLIIYPNDRITDVAVLVTGKSPEFHIIGWIPVAMAKRPRFKKATQDSWWVNMRDLQPMENLVRSSYGAAAL
jgi:hypothetical protein